MAEQAATEQRAKPEKVASLTQKLSSHAIHASQTTMRGWTKFQNWDRNGAYLRTIGGLLCIAFCLNWAIAGASFAFCFTRYTSSIRSFADSAFTTSWDALSVHVKIATLSAGILMLFCGSVVTFLLFPIQILASICAFKLGMDLAAKNMNKHRKEE